MKFSQNFRARVTRSGRLSVTLFPTFVQRTGVLIRVERDSAPRASALNIADAGIPGCLLCTADTPKMRFPLSAREQIALVGQAALRTRSRAPDQRRPGRRRSISNRRHFFSPFRPPSLSLSLMDNPEQTNSAGSLRIATYVDARITIFERLRSATCRTRWTCTDRRTIFGRAHSFIA